MYRVDRQSDETPPLPAIEQPRGLAYFAGTWSGRVILVNTVVFLAMALMSKSILMPTPEVLLAFGAKDPVGLARGEIWRFITPIFVHIGIVHFALNALGLYFIGYQIESVLGPRWFVPVYLISGVMGVIASSVFSVAVSAGASGALFGLLGAGYLVERQIARRLMEMTGARPRRRVYAGVVGINVIFGLVIPGIDNAAHLGGLVSGIAMTWAMLNIRPNRLVARRPRHAIALMVLMAVLGMVGVGLGASREFQVRHFVFESWRAGDNPMAVYHLSRALAIDPENADLHFRRGRVLVLIEELRLGIDDLQVAAASPSLAPRFEDLVRELDAAGRPTEAWQVRRVMEHSGM